MCAALVWFMCCFCFFFKQKTAYEMRISDWTSDVCSSDLSAVMGFPLMVRAVRLSIEAVDRRLEDAAGTLGASPAWVFLTVTLPLIVPGIIDGMSLSFAQALGEFGATIHFVSNIPGEDRKQDV